MSDLPNQPIGTLTHPAAVIEEHWCEHRLREIGSVRLCPLPGKGSLVLRIASKGAATEFIDPPGALKAFYRTLIQREAKCCKSIKDAARIDD